MRKASSPVAAPAGGRSRQLVRACASSACLRARAGVVQPGAATDAIGQWQTRDAVRQQRGRGGVADAHFAEGEDIAAARGDLACQVGAAAQRQGALGLAHGGAVKVIRRAASADFQVAQALARAEVVGHAGIGHHQLHAGQAGQRVDGSAAGEEVFHHLPGHVLRIGRNTGLRRAVVAGADQHVRMPDRRVETALDQAQLQGEILQPAQRTGGFGLAVDFLLQVGAQRAIHGGHGIARPNGGGMHPIHPFDKRCEPARRVQRHASPRHGLDENDRSVFWLPDRPLPAPSRARPSGICKHRPRLQRRARHGVAPCSPEAPVLRPPPPDQGGLWGRALASAIGKPWCRTLPRPARLRRTTPASALSRAR
jgi:hypothetical protein